MNAKAETRSISMEYDLPHPAAKVWRALTDPELLAAWLMVNDMRPLVGHGFTEPGRCDRDRHDQDPRQEEHDRRRDRRAFAGSIAPSFPSSLRR